MTQFDKYLQNNWPSQDDAAELDGFIDSHRRSLKVLRNKR
jgi:hypothetical protein